MSENIRQKRLAILEYFDAYIFHHYQPKKPFLRDSELVKTKIFPTSLGCGRF